MEKLKFINEQLEAIGVPYEFGEWSSDVVYPYFVGEITEEPTMTEDGQESSTMLLTGFTRNGYMELETIKEKIKRHFHPIHGLRGWIGDNAVVVFYEGSFYVPTDEADLKRIQINLQIKEWKVY